MNQNAKLKKLAAQVKALCLKNKAKLLFHGWHHLVFVRKKAAVFAKAIGANVFLVESAALVHDLNYVVRPNSLPEEGCVLRQRLLRKAGYGRDEIERVEAIVHEEHIARRVKNISNEGKALSDADTLFKAMPITDILFTSKYMTENKTDIRALARKILREQEPLVKQGIYFYTPAAKKYLPWAKSKMVLWRQIQHALDDPDIAEVIALIGQ